MIRIFSADPETGKLFTDEKKHFFIDSELLKEKALSLRTRHMLDKIAKSAGWTGADDMLSYLRCSGVTSETFDYWLLSGTLAENLMLC
jgi:hypothetical protein